ncbi:MAG: methionyl-tRNA formyltransferase [Methylobacter sp.]|nr:methionyl-tRNA formyltransferase [Methylobacter sp.]MDP2099889.1 methionyl-tRNA formyltransferase [Methylobacter sp.]MDP2427448.1 methionyl-tRNA formyltransferase [Methylobacter sp.]MDP3054547.1 methionyl-tRNA formyltransferase [Methylobacter sp.]MDP3362152.1 methionyl-tRNA formyltransferase [Methylobacter sp.]
MKIIFAGTPEFAVPCLQVLLDSEHDVCAVYTQPDRPAGRGRKLQPSPVKELALSAGIPVFQPLTLKTDEDLQQISALNADLMVVVAYGMILTQAVLDVPRLGCINVHASLLPRWRGAAPIQRALMAGDEQSGVTIMQIVRKLDAGDMLHKESCAIEPTDTASALHDKLSALGAIGLVKVLAQLEAGTVQPEVQDEALVTYAEKLDKSEAVIDWTQAAADIARKVRGLNAWPVAQTLYQDKVLRIWQAQALDEEATGLQAGVVRCVDKNMDVATGQGWLRLLEVQLPGGKRMPVQAFLSAHDADGVKLG